MDRSDSCSTGVDVAEAWIGATGARSGVCAGSCERMLESCCVDMTPVSHRNSSSVRI